MKKLVLLPYGFFLSLLLLISGCRTLQIPDGFRKVYFIRTPDAATLMKYHNYLAVYAATIIININGRQISSLSSNKYVVIAVEPGTNLSILVANDRHRKLPANCTITIGDKDVFIECKTNQDWMTFASSTVEVVDEQQAHAAIGDLSSPKIDAVFYRQREPELP